MPLRKVCRRPETDYRLQQLHAVNDALSINQQKTSTNPSAVTASRAITPVKTIQKQHSSNAAVVAPVSHANVSVATHTESLEPKEFETGNPNSAGNSDVPLGTAVVGSSSAPFGSTENKHEAKL